MSNRYTDRHTDTQTNRYTDKHTDTQTNRHTHTHTHARAHAHTHTHTGREREMVCGMEGGTKYNTVKDFIFVVIQYLWFSWFV